MTPPLHHAKILAALAAALLFAGSAAAQTAPVQLVPGQPFPEFWGRGLNNETLRVSDFQGRYLLVDFWATWCGPCKAELPNLHLAYQLYHDKGLEILSVSLDPDYGALASFQATDRRKLVWPCIHDRTGELANALEVNAIPRTFFVDPNGVLIGPGLRGAPMLEYFKELFNPDGMGDVVEQWAEAAEDERPALREQFLAAAAKNPDGANSVAWNYLTMSGKPLPEAAGMLREALESGANAAKGSDEAAYVGRLDTAALAAYRAGDAKGAVALQDEVLAVRHRLAAPALPEELVKDRDYADMIVRLGLYNAAAGNLEKAKQCGQFVWPHYGENSSVKRNPLFLDLVKAISPPAATP